MAIYYFYQYALRSAPSVMMPELTEAFGVNALGVSAIVGMFYYGYSPFSLVAGAAIDRFGAKRIIPIGAALVGMGAILFGTGNVAAANIGRFLQGAGGVFALVGAVYLVTKNFPGLDGRVVHRRDADVWHGRRIGWAVSGRSAHPGRLAVGTVLDLCRSGRTGDQCVPGCCFCRTKRPSRSSGTGGLAGVVRSLKTVFVNPQSILCGLISGLLFIPTTIFGMTWGVRFLQEARGQEYEAAVTLAATVPLGWMIGCPLLGFISDRLGRRKPVILGGSRCAAGGAGLGPVRRSCRSSAVRWWGS